MYKVRFNIYIIWVIRGNFIKRVPFELDILLNITIFQEVGIQILVLADLTF